MSGIDNTPIGPFVLAFTVFGPNAEAVPSEAMPLTDQEQILIQGENFERDVVAHLALKIGQEYGAKLRDAFLMLDRTDYYLQISTGIIYWRVNSTGQVVKTGLVLDRAVQLTAVLDQHQRFIDDTYTRVAFRPVGSNDHRGVIPPQVHEVKILRKAHIGIITEEAIRFHAEREPDLLPGRQYFIPVAGTMSHALHAAVLDALRTQMERHAIVRGIVGLWVDRLSGDLYIGHGNEIKIASIGEPVIDVPGEESMLTLE